MKAIEKPWIFFGMTYLFSWSFFLVGGALDFLPIILVGIWGPTITALVLTGIFYGKSGLGQFFSRFRRVSIKWYWWLLLILLPASIHLTGRSLWQLYYDGEINAFFTNPAYWLGAIIPSFIIAGLGEEFGWRGFALPRLQKMFSPLYASLILATFHTLWHLPTYWLGQGIHNVPALYVVLFAFPWTIIFNWLYNKSGGSMIFAISFHAISNASLSIVRFMPRDSEVSISPQLLTTWSLPAELAGPYLSVIGVYWIVAITIVLLGGLKKVNTDTP